MAIAPPDRHRAKPNADTTTPFCEGEYRPKTMGLSNFLWLMLYQDVGSGIVHSSVFVLAYATASKRGDRVAVQVEPVPQHVASPRR